MAERVLIEQGALLRISDDGTVRLRTADGLRMVFAPNPPEETPRDDD